MRSVVNIMSPTKSLRSRLALLMGLSGLLLGLVVTSLIEWRLEAYTFNAQQHALTVAANELKIGRAHV
jgi:hypothetical protein